MVYEMRKLELNKVYCIDCLKGMRLLLDNSVDSVVTDPPQESLLWVTLGIL